MAENPYDYTFESANLATENVAAQTVATVRRLAIELHPKKRLTVSVTLESELDRDLGFDSLGRAELILRLDREFRVRLPDQLIADAITIRDLTEAILVAAPATSREVAHRPPDARVSEPVAEPSDAKTLIDALAHHVRSHAARPHLQVWQSDAIERWIDYGELHRNALKLANGLRFSGVEVGDKIAIMLPTGRSFFFAFFGVLYAGGVPVPIYPPFRRAQIEDHIRRQAGILNNAQAMMLITEGEIRRLAGLLKGLVETLDKVVTADELMRHDALIRPHPADANTTALIQYTSGSTGDPKGVVLSHANLLANIRAMGEALEATSEDLFVSWLPLYHDMGLIGAWLGSLYFGARVIIMSPLTFLADPARWLRVISRNRATLSASPNFAFELCLKNVHDDDLSGVDLSSLRSVVNGAEPVSPNTIQNFTDRFAKFGFKASAMAPVYGLAECSVGLAFPPVGRMPIIDRVERTVFVRSGLAKSAKPDDPSAIEFVACGRPLTGHQIRIVDDFGLELPERQQGRLQFMGPSTTRGYNRNEQKNRELFSGAWLESGDLAYVSTGDIFLTGRIKDLIIRAGRNIYPHEIEELIGTIPGVRKGCIAAFASPDPHTGSERLIVLVETRLIKTKELEQLKKTISETSRELLDVPPDEIILAPPHTVPKTSSGKIRRSAAKSLFEAGALEGHTQDLWLQVVRLELVGIANRLRWAIRSVSTIAYAGYWWMILGLLACAVWPLVILAPKRPWRHAIIGGAAKMLFRLTGTGFEVTDNSMRELDRVVFVVNHSSYLDGAAISAAIPGELSFVAKQELANQFFAHAFLGRIGTHFVRRVDTSAGVEGAEEIVAAARTGERICTFPEGTLLRMPGLLSFRLGAFMAAVQAGVPIVPVAIQGTRMVLRGEQWIPRRGNIVVDIGGPIWPTGSDFQAAIRLREAARAWILEHCGEPDLAGERVDLGEMGML